MRVAEVLFHLDERIWSLTEDSLCVVVLCASTISEQIATLFLFSQ